MRCSYLARFGNRLDKWYVGWKRTEEKHDTKLIDGFTNRLVRGWLIPFQVCVSVSSNTFNIGYIESEKKNPQIAAALAVSVIFHFHQGEQENFLVYDTSPKCWGITFDRPPPPKKAPGGDDQNLWGLSVLVVKFEHFNKCKKYLH